MDFETNPGLWLVALPSRAEERLRRLPPAERDVARGLINGKTNAAIAQERGTAERTIANQVAAIFRNYGVGSRSELARALERESSPSLH